MTRFWTLAAACCAVSCIVQVAIGVDTNSTETVNNGLLLLIVALLIWPRRAESV